MSLERVARLLGPPDGSGCDVIDAGEGWDALPSMRESGRGRPSPIGGVVWGRMPAPSGTAPRDAALRALRRERALQRVRSRFGGARVTRWPSPDLGGARAWNVLRTALLSGAIVEIDPPRERLVDAAARAAGAAAVQKYRPISGGALLAQVEVGGRHVLLRVGGSYGSLPPSPLVPRVLGHGAVSGIAWRAETVLPGRRPARLTRAMWDACVELSASLPRADAPDAVRDDVEALANAIPPLASDVRAAGVRAWNGLASLGGAARHGDLWRPNLLAARGRLTGVVDWDASHPAAAPGVDLLNLWATERHGAGLGDAWHRRPWRSPEFLAATRAYWRQRGIDPYAADMDAVAVAWWAGQAAGSVRRLPHLAQRTDWIESNVSAVLRSL